MTVAAADIARLRRMVAEPTTTTYSDSVLSETIARYPVRDADGLAPTDTDWTATYDLNAAASDVWSEKAAALATAFDFTADGGSFQRSQSAKQAQLMASYYRSRRYARSVVLSADLSTTELDDDG
jgi:hypothetical protein